MNNEDDIKPNTGNSGCQLPLPSKNISWSAEDRVNKLYSEEVTYITRQIIYQIQSHKELTMNNQDTAKAIVVDRRNFKSTGGKDI